MLAGGLTLHGTISGISRVRGEMQPPARGDRGSTAQTGIARNGAGLEGFGRRKRSEENALVRFVMVGFFSDDWVLVLSARRFHT